MSKANAIIKFLNAARSLANQGLSRDAIVQFAKNEFGEINELFQKQIDNIFKPRKGIENIEIKDPDFDDTIVKMQFDDAGVPFNPKDPLKTKTLSYEEAVAREKAKADADEDYIMKIFDPEDFAQGGRAGYAVGNQVTPQVDARMNLDYNTLVDQNQAQAATQAKNRKPFKQNFLDRVGYTQHMNEDRMLKDANIENQLMNRMGGLNVTQANPAFGLQNPLGPGIGMTMLGGAAGAYQGIQSLAGALGLGPKQSLGEMVKDTYENTMGQTILANSKQLEMYNKALSRPTEPVVDQDRISEIVEQQKAAGVPDEGLITNFQQDDGSSVIPNFEKLSDGSYKDTRSGDIYGAETYASIAAGMYPNIYDPNSQTLAQGGRAGYYTGGMVDVEPNLSDIGHGSDALMARTRLVSPDGQATTSTGLNYLLAEDNDNIRVPFSKGKLVDAARRKFMKAAGTGAAGLAALKTGLLGFGEKAAPVVEKAVETAQGVPPYFLNLVNKIRKMGEFTLASKDKANAYKFKDYIMEEDFAGNIEIIKKGGDIDGNKIEDVYMSYKVDEVPVKKGGSSKVEDYEEFTARPDGEGKMKDIEQGVPDEVVQEGTMFEDDITDFGKASGGIARMIGE